MEFRKQVRDLQRSSCSFVKSQVFRAKRKVRERDLAREVFRGTFSEALGKKMKRRWVLSFSAKDPTRLAIGGGGEG